MKFVFQFIDNDFIKFINYTFQVTCYFLGEIQKTENINEDSLKNELFKRLIELMVDSPLLLFFLGILFLLGYGISFIIFSYRRNSPPRLVNNQFHLILGLSYVASVFLLINRQIFLGDEFMPIEQIILRLPETLVISLALFFIVIILVTIHRESKQ